MKHKGTMNLKIITNQLIGNVILLITQHRLLTSFNRNLGIIFVKELQMFNFEHSLNPH